MKNYTIKISTLDVIKNKETKRKIKERCGKNIISDGIQCTHCNCDETFKDGDDIENTDKWFFMIRAFRVDNASECINCGSWFYS